MQRLFIFHAVSWLLLIVDFTLWVNKGVSFRGQLVEAVVTLAPILSGAFIAIRYFKKLNIYLKIYFVPYAVYIFSCCLVIPAIPLYLPVYQFPSIENGKHVLRKFPSIMGPPTLVLLERSPLFEREVAFVQYWELKDQMVSWSEFDVKSINDGFVTVAMKGKRDTLLLMSIKNKMN